jgi:hypothetical protein
MNKMDYGFKVAQSSITISATAAGAAALNLFTKERVTNK